jgi:hypothetical protein
MPSELIPKNSEGNMGTAQRPVTSAFEAIPDPDAVKARLANIAAEARLLRPLLRLAERKARELLRLQDAGGNDRAA